jgi:hypothetical protein
MSVLTEKRAYRAAIFRYKGGSLMLRIIFAMLLIGFSAVGCATPARYTNSPQATYDKHVEYAIDTRDDGFSIRVSCLHSHPLPDNDAVADACKIALTTIAQEYAENNGKKIQPINEQRIEISMGQNGVNEITTCSANALAQWQN